MLDRIILCLNPEIVLDPLNISAFASANQKKAPRVEAPKRLIFNVENIGIEPMTS